MEKGLDFLKKYTEPVDSTSYEEAHPKCPVCGRFLKYFKPGTLFDMVNNSTWRCVKEHFDWESGYWEHE